MNDFNFTMKFKIIFINFNTRLSIFKPMGIILPNAANVLYARLYLTFSVLSYV